MNEKYDYKKDIYEYCDIEFFNSWNKSAKNRLAKPKKVKFEIDYSKGINPYKLKDFDLPLSQKDISKELDNFEIKDIENYLRKKKLEQLKKA